MAVAGEARASVAVVGDPHEPAGKTVENTEASKSGMSTHPPPQKSTDISRGSLPDSGTHIPTAEEEATALHDNDLLLKIAELKAQLNPTKRLWADLGAP